MLLRSSSSITTCRHQPPRATQRAHRNILSGGWMTRQRHATGLYQAGDSAVVQAGQEPGETSPLIVSQDSISPNPAAGSSALAHNDTVDWLATGLCFIFPALGGLLFGYDIGATSGVLVSLTSPQLSGTDWYSLSPFQSGLVVSSSLLGALGGSCIALAAGNSFGRRTELLLASALYGVASAGVGVTGSLPALLAARLVYGVGMGFAMHAAPAYIAETSPPSARGLLISLKEAVIVGGILLGYLSSYWFIDDVGGWRSMYGVAAPLALLLGIGMTFLPESPRWLLLSGAGRAAALEALVKAEGRRAADPAIAAAEIDAMAASIAESQQPAGSRHKPSDDGESGSNSSSNGHGADAVAVARTPRFGDGLTSLGELFADPKYLQPLLVGMSLMLFQQVTGQPSVLYYAGKIFEAAGFAGGSEAARVSVLLGTFKLLMTLVAVATVDKWGRRPLLLTGVSGMVVALFALSAAQGGLVPPGTEDAAMAAAAAAGDGGVSIAAWASALALLLYVGSYQMSFGPISWLIVGEVFPLAVRSQAIALASLVNFGSNFGVSLVLPSLQTGVGMQGTYALFGVIGAGAVAYIYRNVPETKGKTLEEIEEIWKR